MNGIDVHTHVVPESFPDLPAGAGNLPWPSMRGDGCGHAHVMLSGAVYRTVGDNAWSPRKRCADMDQAGIERQVLSPMPELLSYGLPSGAAAVLLRHVNEQIAQMVGVDPRRFSGLAAVPLQDVDLAIRELEHAAHSLGLAGVEVGTNVNGMPLGDARNEPFFAAAEELGMAVFVHGFRPDRSRLVGPAVLEQIVGFPCEVALAVASMITSGTLTRHPNLRIAYSHGGGAFALVLARMEHTWHKVAAFRESLVESPRAIARRLFFDTTVFDIPALRYLADTFGHDRMLIGTDYPFGSHERDPVGFLRRAGFDEAAFSAICRGNALRYLALPE